MIDVFIFVCFASDWNLVFMVVFIERIPSENIFFQFQKFRLSREKKYFRVENCSRIHLSPHLISLRAINQCFYIFLPFYILLRFIDTFDVKLIEKINVGKESKEKPRKAFRCVSFEEAEVKISWTCHRLHVISAVFRRKVITLYQWTYRDKKW